jgi:hypothetical protein
MHIASKWNKNGRGMLAIGDSSLLLSLMKQRGNMREGHVLRDLSYVLVHFCRAEAK